MITIEEQKVGNETIYIKTCSSDDKEPVVTRISSKAVSVTKNNRVYYLIYDSKMKVRSSAFEFVNNALSDKSENTRIKANEALKFLFCFEDIIGKSVSEFKQTDITALKYFLHGYSPEGSELNISLLTIRSNDTVNGYLSVYRNYLRFLEIEKHALFEVSGTARITRAVDSEVAVVRNSYRTNDRKPIKQVEVPRYISVDEFTSILTLVREKYTLREECVIRLMFQCGLRIGEVLGLTADDLVMEKLDNGEYAPLAYLRNRVTDNKDQNAKTCMKVSSIKQYKTEDYQTLNCGYQYVVVPQDLFDLINEYIEDVHTSAREKSHDRYYAKTIADRVRDSEEYEDDNYYIFINSIGTPISASSWNDTLRGIFAEVGIPVDRDCRKSNLNHRFRHGFAMYNVMYLNVKEVELARLLRHSSLASVYCYYRPTTSDQIKLKTDFANSLYEVIPNLKRDD